LQEVQQNDGINPKASPFLSNEYLKMHLAVLKHNVLVINLELSNNVFVLSDE